MGQFRKSVKRLENDKRLADLFVKIDEKSKKEIETEQADLPDLSAKAKKISMADISNSKD